MSLLNALFGKKQSQPPVEPGAVQLSLAESTVEDIVEYLRQNPPARPLGYMVLFGNRPLTGNFQGEGILSFTRKQSAESFIVGYEDLYACSQPLSVLAVAQISELWALLHNRALDPLYKPPYGLFINFNYGGRPANQVKAGDLQHVGEAGLKKIWDSTPK